MELTKEQVEDIASTARGAFWVELARAAEKLGSSSFGSDLMPETDAHFETASENVVREWFRLNVSDRASKMWKDILRLTPAELLAAELPDHEDVQDEFRDEHGRLVADAPAFVWIDKETGWYFTEGIDGMCAAKVDRHDAVFRTPSEAMEHLRKNYFE